MRLALAALALVAVLAAPAAAQTPPNMKALQDAQREAMKPLAMMDGVWRGPAWTMTETGRHEVTQTERIGPFLDGQVKVMEGRGYDKATGEVTFNAFGIVSYDVRTKAYSLRSWAQGQSGEFPLKPTANGYVWEIPAGPGAIIRYTAVIGPNDWREIGERIVGGGAPVQMFEMNLKRVGKTSWPAADPVPPK